jgi:hypothetical protein
MIIISNSSRARFSCKRGWWWAHRMKLKRKETKLPFKVGGIWHNALESAYETFSLDGAKGIVSEQCSQWFDETLDTTADDDQLDKVSKSTETLEKMIENYKGILKGHSERWEILGIEVPFAIGIRRHWNAKRGKYKGFKLELLDYEEISKPGYKSKYLFIYVGVIDLVVKDKGTGYIYGGEHKTTNRDVRSFERSLQLQTQPTGYLIAIDLMIQKNKWQAGSKNEVTGMIYNIAKKDFPGTPGMNKCKKCNTSATAKKGRVVGLNKDGTQCEKCGGTGFEAISGREISTDYKTFMKVFDKYPHLKQEDYQDRIDILKGYNEDIYHNEFTYYASHEKRHEFLNDLYETFRDIKRFEKLPKDKHYPAPHWKCEECPYFELCNNDDEGIKDIIYEVETASDYPREYLKRVIEIRDKNKPLNKIETLF